MEEMTSDLMQEYEAYLKASGIVMNTISFYMRILRAVYNRAVEKGIVEQRNPFRHVYTGIDKTVKRALALKEIRKIKELDLTFYPALDFARDMFLFSFYYPGPCPSLTWLISKNPTLKTAYLSIAGGKRGSSFLSNGKNACRQLWTNTRCV